MPQGYNEEDFAEMQQQAIRRVKEMQQRAKPAALTDENEETENSRFDANRQSIEQIFKSEKKQQIPNPKREYPKDREQPKLSPQAQRVWQKQQHEHKQQGMLSSLFHLDSDVSLILPLLLLLGREGADDILLLALLYIMA